MPHRSRGLNGNIIFQRCLPRPPGSGPQGCRTLKPGRHHVCDRRILFSFFALPSNLNPTHIRVVIHYHEPSNFICYAHALSLLRSDDRPRDRTNSCYMPHRVEADRMATLFSEDVFHVHLDHAYVPSNNFGKQTVFRVRINHSYHIIPLSLQTCCRCHLNIRRRSTSVLA